MSGEVVVLSALVDRHIRAHGEETYPLECCGYLVANADGEIVEARRLTNLNTDRAHDRYELDPREQMKVERAIDDAGLFIAGVYHSHPDCPARPSETDRASGVEGWVFAIVAVHEAKARELTYWQLDGAPWEGGQFGQLPALVTAVPGETLMSERLAG